MSLKIVFCGAFLAGLSLAELPTLRGNSYVDITRDAAEVSIDVAENLVAGGVDKTCGLFLRSNVPFASARRFEKLARLLRVERELDGGFEVLPAKAGQDSIGYFYKNAGMHGSVIRISTAGKETLEKAVRSAFDVLVPDIAARVIVTLIPCTKP